MQSVGSLLSPSTPVKIYFEFRDNEYPIISFILFSAFVRFVRLVVPLIFASSSISSVLPLEVRIFVPRMTKMGTDEEKRFGFLDQEVMGLPASQEHSL